MIGKRMSDLRAVASIAVGSMAGAAAAIPGSIAGLFIAWACLPGPFSNEIIMVLPSWVAWAGPFSVCPAERSGGTVVLLPGSVVGC